MIRFYSSWQPVTSEVLQGSILGSKLFDTFISNLHNSIESSLTKFADDTKLVGEGGMSCGRAILQRHLDRLKEWASTNCMKFTKLKC